MSQLEVLAHLEAVIDQRDRERPEGSYVTQLLERGEPALVAKLREEAAELAEADPGSVQETAHEAADLIFHALVLLRARGVSLADVCGVLEQRFGVGGLVEKAARSGGATG